MTRLEAEELASGVNATRPLRGDGPAITSALVDEVAPGRCIVAVYFENHVVPCLIGSEPDCRLWLNKSGYPQSAYLESA